MDTKLGVWRVLPWRLAGSAGVLHHDVHQARFAARDCLSLYRQSEDETQQHRFARKCLRHESPIAADIAKFAAGSAELADFCDEALETLLQLKFLPCCERIIESRHGAVASALSGKKKKKSPVSVSLLSGRLLVAWLD